MFPDEFLYAYSRGTDMSFLNWKYSSWNSWDIWDKWSSWSSWSYSKPSGKVYDDIGRGDWINAGCGDDTFIVTPFKGKASVDGNGGEDCLDLTNLDPDSYVLSYKSWCGSLFGTVTFLDDNGCKTGVLCFSDIEKIKEPDPIVPDGYVDGTDGNDLIDPNYVDVDGDRIDDGDALFVPNEGTDADVVRAFGGDDTIFGVNGFDQINAGSGNDLAYGNGDVDYLYGEEGNDTLYGGEGNDSLHGGDNEDVLYGGAGNDRIYGNNGDDTIIGGDGDDVLYGDNSFGNIDGTVGNDVFVFDADDGSDTIWDFVKGTHFIELEGYVAGSLEPSIEYRPAVDNSFVTFGETTIRVIGVEVTMDDFIL